MKYQKQDLAKFPYQIRYATAHYKKHGLSYKQFDNVVLCGLGGSGIAGRIVKSYFYRSFPLPVDVISDYNLPQYVTSKSLTIMCSYSGNTEETLSMYAEAKAKGATIISIATGGKLAEMSNKDGYLFYQAEAGFQPRMALGYSLTYLLLIFGELMGKDNKGELEHAAKAVENEESFLAHSKKMLDEHVKKNYAAKLAVITDYFSYPIGLRFCQQIQENAKAEAFLHELPESNHNVIESYYGKLDSIFIFLNSHLNKRTDLRFSFLKDLLENNKNAILSIDVNPDSLADVFKVIYTLDWLSLWIADHKGVNSMQIPNINALKEHLSKH